MDLLNRDQILKVEDTQYETVSAPEWGGKVRVRGALAIERDEYEQSLNSTKIDDDGKVTIAGNYSNAKARFVVKCVVDEKGNRIFKDEDAETLGKKSSAVINRVFQRIAKLSGMDRKSNESLAKNSGAGQDGSSVSSLPAT